MTRKLIAFEDDTLHRLTMLGQTRMASLQELADEAFTDLLKKHGQPVDLSDALKQSVADGRSGRSSRAGAGKRGPRVKPRRAPKR
jgi:hypothetical protein